MARRILALLLVISLLATGAFAATYRDLQRGDRDGANSWDVYSLQIRLVELGYLKGTIDGVYGKGTERAVKEFQKVNSLPQTGVADVATQQALYASTALTPSGTVLSTEITGDSLTDGGSFIDITWGSKGESVFTVQSCMYQWGFLESEPDGVYGEATCAALKNFQNYVMEDMRRFLLERAKAQEAAATPEPTAAPGEMEIIYDVKLTPEPSAEEDGVVTPEWFDYITSAQFKIYKTDMAIGSRGPEVRRLQRRLVGLKYAASGIDGTYGEHTAAQLKYFQRRNGLEETGAANQETIEKLYSGTAVKSDKYVSLYKAYVSIDKQEVYIYQWTGGDYAKLLHTFKCSTGTVQSPTILGTFQATGKSGEWYYFEDSAVWARYIFVIEGGYFFHSTLYDAQDPNTAQTTSIKLLGTRASHGCVRLALENAIWIYENCANGMTVVIYEGESPN